ncbi:MAG: aquaporin [Patescibacteria group bacterium]
MKVQKYVAELLGTFTLAFAVAISAMMGSPVPTPLIAAVTLAVFVYTVGSVSGAHLNPAVTLAMATVKKISVPDAAMYIVVQLLAGFAAFHLAQWLVATPFNIEDFPRNAGIWKEGLMEAMGAFILVFGVSSVVWKKAPEQMAGWVIGTSLFVGLMIAGGLSLGVLNPAVALGIGLKYTSYMYFVAPLVGGILAAWVYKYLAKK